MALLLGDTGIYSSLLFAARGIGTEGDSVAYMGTWLGGDDLDLPEAGLGGAPEGVALDEAKTGVEAWELDPLQGSEAAVHLLLVQPCRWRSSKR